MKHRRNGWRIRLALWCGGVLLSALCLMPPFATAQNRSPALPSALQNSLPPGVSAQDVINAIKNVQGTGVGTTVQQVGPQAAPQYVPPTTAPPRPEDGQPSLLEQLYSQRIGVPIEQFGYGQFSNTGTVNQVLSGAVQDSYILGQGDQITVTLVGPQGATFTTAVDRNGNVVLPNLPPISAAGRSLGDVRRDIQTAVNKAYVQTQSYVSVEQIRQISVRVVGNVSNPGVYALTGLSTLLDALNLAGGINKAGSLRNITLVRNGVARSFDLYSLLLPQFPTPDMTLAEGDRIIVPAIGATVAITGDVRRPAIFELPAGETSISARALMQLGDGVKVRGAYREMILRIRKDGKEELVDTSRTLGAPVRNGEVLFVEKAVSQVTGQVDLEGAVRLSGLYPLDKFKTLRDLLPSASVLQPSAYMLFGVIQHTDQATLEHKVVPFSLVRVLKGLENHDLGSGDTVWILSVAEMRDILGNLNAAGSTNPTQQSVNPSTPPAAGPPAATAAGTAGAALAGLIPGATLPSAAPGTAAPGTTAAGTAAAASQASAPAPATAQSATGSATTPEVMGGAAAPSGASGILASMSAADATYFGNVLSDYRVSLDGAVHNPGPYLVAPGTTLDELVAAAGGLDSDVDLSSFELTSTNIDNKTGESTTDQKDMHVQPAEFASVVLKPLDSVVFLHVFTDRLAGNVSVTGEVRHPGTYPIIRGQHLSQLLVRAGGLTDVAYPYGAVFQRMSLKTLEQQANDRIANDLEQQLFSGLGSATGIATSVGANATGTTGNFQLMEELIAEFRTRAPVGRLVVEADPSVLAVNPSRDPLLQPGDTIFIPQRPDSVSIIGDVGQPGNYPFRPDQNVDDYVAQAGGYGADSEQDLTVIVFPDGRASSVDQSWLRFTHQQIPPGSTIYVPRNIFPTTWLPIATSVVEIFKDLALSTASLAVLSRNN